MKDKKIKAPRNRTLVLTEDEIPSLKKELLTVNDLRSFQNDASVPVDVEKILDKTINSDLLEVLPLLPDEFADLIIIDPPYNLTKNFAGKVFKKPTTNILPPGSPSSVKN